MAWTPPKTWTEKDIRRLPPFDWWGIGILAILVATIAWCLGAAWLTWGQLLKALAVVVFGVWTTPKTWTAVVVTVADLNTHIRDNLNAFLGPQTIYIDAMSLVPDLTNGCDAPTTITTTADRPMVMGCGFSGSADQYSQCKMPFPKQWNAASITFRPRWTATAAGAGDVQWRLQALGRSDGDSIDTAWTASVTSTDTFQSAKNEHIGPTSGGLTIDGSAVKGDTIYFRIWRNATNGSDTKAEKVYLLGFEIFLTMDTVNDT